MDIPRVSDSVRRITVLRKDAGGISPVIIYERQGSKKKRKGTRALRGFERATRGMLKAQKRATVTYLSRHNRSNTKRRDGWIRDLGLNSLRAAERGTRALNLSRIILP